MISDEQLILSSLLNNPQYIDKTLPYLKPEYFRDQSDREIYETIIGYIDEYKTVPDKVALSIAFNDGSWTNPDEVRQKLNLLFEIEPAKDQTWLVNQTEKFCQNQAVYIAIMKAISIYDGTETKISPLAIPEMMRDAVSISFDTQIGMDYLDSAEARWEYYNTKENVIPFNLDILNSITINGIPKKTLNVLVAGCVHPDTKVRIRYRKPK